MSVMAQWSGNSACWPRPHQTMNELGHQGEGFAMEVSAAQEKTAMEYLRGKLLVTLERDVLLREVVLERDGSCSLRVDTWDEYWRPVHSLHNFEVDGVLEMLRMAWQEYLSAGFERSLARPYCLQYFRLLEVLLGNGRATLAASDYRAALQCAVGFETFGIAFGQSMDKIAAATTNVRNPSYLLSRIRYPGAPDDSKFLPLVTVPATQTIGGLAHRCLVIRCRFAK